MFGERENGLREFGCDKRESKGNRKGDANGLGVCTGYGEIEPPLLVDTDRWSMADLGDDPTTNSMGETVLGVGAEAEQGER